MCLQEAEKRGKKLFLYTGPQPQARANAAVLVGLPLACNSRLGEGTKNSCDQHQQQHCGVHVSCTHAPRHVCAGPPVLQVGIYQVLYLNRTPEDAYAPLAPKGPYMPFRDASCGIPTFNLQPIDCIRVRTHDACMRPSTAAARSACSSATAGTSSFAG